MSNTMIHATSALRPASMHSATRVVPTSPCATRSAHTVVAMWSKQLPVALDAAVAVKANRNKGAMGAPGFWDPV